MCYNCGCSIPTDDMGNPKNITDQTLTHLAQKRGKGVDDLKKELLNYLSLGETADQEFESMFATAAATWKQPVEEAKKETLKLLKTHSS